jgi:signal transduction histidine kinase
MSELYEELELIELRCNRAATEGMRDLLTYSKLRKRQRAKPSAHPGNLDVATMTATVSWARGSGATVDVDVPGRRFVEGDLDLLVLVLQNVVGNSIKYSKNGCVRLSARRDERGLDDVVSDEGPEFPSINWRIFEASARGCQ